MATDTTFRGGGARQAAFQIGSGTSSAIVPKFALVDGDGNQAAGGARESFTLADNKSAAGDYPATPSSSISGQIVYGGDYVWTVVGTLGSGGSAALKSVIRNTTGAIVSTQTLATKTAADTAGGTGVGLGSNAEVYVTLAGANLSGVSVVLSRLP